MEVEQTIMNTRLLKAFFAVVCLFGLSAVANAQAPAQVTPKAVTYTTKPKLIIAKLKKGETELAEVRGNASFTVVGANSNGTFAGTFTYTIPDASRQKIAEASGQPLNSIPASVTRKDVEAEFEKGTDLPLLHLTISPKQDKMASLNVAGVNIVFTRISVDINGRNPDAGAPAYTTEEMEALFSKMAIQINRGRAYRGVVTRMNKVINGEPD